MTRECHVRFCERLGVQFPRPTHQYFCGEEYFRHELPCHPTSLTRWRKRLGEEGCEWLLSETVEAAKRLKLVKRTSLERVTVDTTVSEKAIDYPTDARLYERSRQRLGQVGPTVWFGFTPKLRAGGSTAVAEGEPVLACASDET